MLMHCGQSVLNHVSCCSLHDTLPKCIALRCIASVLTYQSNSGGLLTQSTSQSVVAAELDPSKLARFLRRVEDGYNDTPYHSKAHAADVLQSMHTLLTLGGLASRMDDELVMLAGELLVLLSSCNCCHAIAVGFYGLTGHSDAITSDKGPPTPEVRHMQ